MVLALTFCAGCYDGDQLIEMARAEALETRLEEIELGSYYTSLPRNLGTATTTEIEFRVFGTVPHSRVDEIREQLASDSYRLRYATLSIVRQATPAELAEPDLSTLKQRLKTAANSILADAPIQAVGFEQLQFVIH